MATTYDAFISYSHAADGKLAPALQSALQRFAKPWYRRRALRIFRDQTSLAATPELWPTIQKALDGSHHFLLLASPEAARSKWVRREVAHWRATKPLDRLLIVLTGGELAWDEAADDFDWARTDALPEELCGAFASEPLWVDLRWARGEEQLSLKHPRFLEAVGDLAAPLRGQPKEDLLGEDIRQHRRAVRLAGAAIAALAILLVAAVVAAGVALEQRQVAVAARGTAEAETVRAEHQARVALSRQLSAQALNNRDELDLGLLLAVQASKIDPDSVEVQGDLLAVLESSPHLMAFLPGQDGRANSVAFHPDGQILAAAGSDGYVRFWDVAKRELRGEPLNIGSSVLTLAFNTDGSRFAAGTAGGAVLLWDVSNEESPDLAGSRLDAHPGGVNQLSFSPNGDQLATAGQDGAVRVWEAPGLNPVDELVEDSDGSSSIPVLAVAYGPTGQVLAAARENGTVIVWEPATPDARRLIFAHTGWANAVAYSPDGQQIATAGADSVVQLWDAITLDPIATPLRGHVNDVLALAFSPDGQALASGSRDGTVRFWDIGSGDAIGAPLSGSGDSVLDISFSPDGTTLVSASQNGKLVLWDLVDEHYGLLRIPAHNQSAMTLTFNSEGSLLASGGLDGKILVWRTSDLDAGTTSLTTHIERDVGSGGAVFGVRFSPDDTQLVAASSDGMYAMDTATWAIEPPVIEEYTADVALSRDGHHLASITPEGGGGRLRTWEIPTWSPVESATLKLRSPIAGAIAFSADGTRLAVAEGNAVSWRDATTLVPVWRDEGVGRWPVTVAVDRGGVRIATAWSDGTIRLRNLDGELIGELTNGHSEIIGPLAFSPDDRLLASGSSDGTIRLWDVAARTPIGPPLPTGAGSVMALAFSPDGSRLVSANEDGSLIWAWDVTVASWQAHACKKASRNLTREEWSRFLGDEPYVETCAQALTLPTTTANSSATPDSGSDPVQIALSPPPNFPKVAPDAGSYESSDNGYAVTWDRSYWRVNVGQNSGSELTLQSDTGASVLFDTVDAADIGSPEVCVDTMTARIEKVPEVESLQPLQGLSRPNYPRSSGSRETMEFSLAFDDGTALDLVQHLDCRPLNGDGGFLLITVVAKRQGYEQELPAIEALLANGVTPADLASPAASPGLHTDRVPSTRMHRPSEREGRV